MADAASCNTCGKSASSELTLKRCARCKTKWYCSHDCQKADWKNHKKACGKSGTDGTPNNDNNNNNNKPTAEDATRRYTTPRPKNLEVFIEKPFHELHSKTWLHNRPKNDVYKLLIDTYRMKMDDQYTFEGEVDVDCVYGGKKDSRIGFRRFLRMVENKSELLPPWWSPEHTQACMAFGLRRQAGDMLSMLACAVEKSDIIEHYDDRFMPMQLRMFGEQIYGKGPAGHSGAAMLAFQMMIEENEGKTTVVT
ncbi:putative MYND domain protein [Aspergillus heteromorphus CBS 117.55]|uniref:Putative MYND domain protein n=1 Tax=Aspergillus heteromorphus CBS 117.55 TaxID=1448321 RepID=A0A317WQN7_9EURO|nr:putative MYND domain protein [Aspergillus heteromorphus CBS 117.55]PWY88375.1 putative MYND domain protein [Aspergillus heteromorphus CBS 117.55]